MSIIKKRITWTNNDLENLKNEFEEILSKIESSIFASVKDWYNPRAKISTKITLLIVFISGLLLYLIIPLVKDLSYLERKITTSVAYLGLVSPLILYFDIRFFSTNRYKKRLSKMIRAFKVDSVASNPIISLEDKYIKYKNIKLQKSMFFCEIESNTFKGYIFRRSFFKLITFPFIILIPKSQAEEIENLMFT